MVDMENRVVGAMAVVLLLALSFSTLLGAPPKAEAYTWSAWKTRYVSATTRECNAAKVAYAEARKNGPVAYTGVCKYRLRWRYANISGWTGWQDRIVQLENAAPVMPGAWGMKLQVRIHWNGARVRYEPASLLCQTWGFMINITKEDCKVFGDNTTALTPRMSYFAGWSYLFGSVSVNRGAQKTFYEDGSSDPIVMWP